MHKSEPFSRTLAFIVALLVLLIGSVIGYLIGNWGLAIAIDGVLLVAILILRPILFPPWHEHSDVRTLTLTIFAATASSFGLWDSIVPTVVGWIFSVFGIPTPEFPTIWQQIIILGIVGIILVLITNAFERKQILPQPSGQPTTEQDEAFPKADYKELRDRFCDFMVGEIDRIDVELNWSNSDFTVLEAEIVVEKGGSSRPKIARDLVAAIRDDHKTRTFILIGDPGSGKSVSLRRLVRELYKRVPETGIVPLYINLREWDGPREPTDSDIVEFISRYLLRVSGRAGQSFLKNWYEPMLMQGLFFFLLDSFDEMPVVMDCDDRSPELKKISEAFDRFFHDIHHCRGVLSSRPFRQPVGVRGRRLNVKPFTETQIRMAMRKWLKGYSIDANSIVRKIFIERPELAPAIRNPFMADLISQYVINFPNKLPGTYYELYEHYVSKRLNDSVDYLKQLGLSMDDVITAATQIAWTMYNTPETGLEIETSKLETLMNDPRLSDEIKAMSFSRIARLGGIGRDRFTFVHRRFAEFFAVRSIHTNNIKMELTSIPSDSRWRDALVVYSGIAPIERVQELATFSWQIIRENSDALIAGDFRKAMPAIHSLRFLRDAFQSRPESTTSFNKELSSLIVKATASDDLLVAKLAAEALPLTNPEARTNGIEIAFTRRISWLSETALRSCRHLANLEQSAVSQVQEYIRGLSTTDLFRSLFDLNFSLSLSEAFYSVRVSLLLQVISLLILWTLTPLLSILIDIQQKLSLGSSFLLIISTTLSLELFAVFFRFLFQVFLQSSHPSSDLNKRINKIYGPTVKSLERMRKADLMLRIATALVLIIPITLGNTKVEPIQTNLHPVYYLIFPLLIIVIPWDYWYSLYRYLKTNNLFSSINNLFKNIRDTMYRGFKAGIINFILLLSGMIIYIYFFEYIIKFIEQYIFILLAPIYALLFLYMLYYLIKALNKRFNDLRNLKRMSNEKEITWSLLWQSIGTFQTEWGQARFIELIRINKVNVTEYTAIFDSSILKGNKSKEQLARLQEQILGLQE